MIDGSTRPCKVMLLYAITQKKGFKKNVLILFYFNLVTIFIYLLSFFNVLEIWEVKDQNIHNNKELEK